MHVSKVKVDMKLDTDANQIKVGNEFTLIAIIRPKLRDGNANS